MLSIVHSDVITAMILVHKNTFFLDHLISPIAPPSRRQTVLQFSGFCAAAAGQFYIISGHQWDRAVRRSAPATAITLSFGPGTRGFMYKCGAVLAAKWPHIMMASRGYM